MKTKMRPSSMLIASQLLKVPVYGFPNQRRVVGEDSKGIIINIWKPCPIKEWFSKIPPSLENNSVIVLNNASYYPCEQEKTQAQPEINKWLPTGFITKILLYNGMLEQFCILFSKISFPAMHG